MECPVKKREGLLSRLSHPQNLTEGCPWRVILKYSLPIILSCLLQQIYSMTDAAICGQILSAGEVAGVNDTGPLTFFFLQFAFGCTGGFGVITAGCVGRADERGIRRSFTTQVILASVISLFLIVLSIIFLPSMLGLINLTPESGDVYTAAYDYCLVIFIGIFAQMGYNFFSGFLRSYGDSVTPLIFLIISATLNVFLDFLFLAPLDMGPSGAAAATVISQLISLVLCAVFTFTKYKNLRPEKGDWKIGAHDVKSHLAQGLPLGMQFSILAIGIIVMQGAIVSFDIRAAGSVGEMVPGAPAQNGFGAASKLTSFLMAPYSGLSSAVLGYTAQNYGRGNRDRICRGTGQSILIMLVFYILTTTIGLLMSIGGAYQHIFLSADKISEASLRYGNCYLYLAVFTMCVLGFLVVARSAVQGICKVGYAFSAGIAELIARITICSLLPTAVNGAPINESASTLAFVAVCLGDPGAWLSASLVLAIPIIKYTTSKKR